MNQTDQIRKYLEYCKFRKELDEKTIKAYRIDLGQFEDYVSNIGKDSPDKEVIEDFITLLHKKFKQKTVKRKIASLKAYYNYLEEKEIN